MEPGHLARDLHRAGDDAGEAHPAQRRLCSVPLCFTAPYPPNASRHTVFLNARESARRCGDAAHALHPLGPQARAPTQCDRGGARRAQAAHTSVAAALDRRVRAVRVAALVRQAAAQRRELRQLEHDAPPADRRDRGGARLGRGAPALAHARDHGHLGALIELTGALTACRAEIQSVT